ncbi:hypothetical protein BDN70DRAFT_368028 [Pholiota conissans]|uniref:Uncharacterized protein n=1 Tax=Pholiota conissans TaxID=109636 RepID=A0A9P5ZDC7_9AGAR|nr:hypothetical protein BDN70DRAFT_368028 [Pholiota conissans]
MPIVGRRLALALVIGKKHCTHLGQYPFSEIPKVRILVGVDGIHLVNSHSITDPSKHIIFGRKCGTMVETKLLPLKICDKLQHTATGRFLCDKCLIDISCLLLESRRELVDLDYLLVEGLVSLRNFLQHLDGLFQMFRQSRRLIHRFGRAPGVALWFIVHRL